MILGVTGHRKVINIEFVKNQIHDILIELKPSEVISGMAQGYDLTVVKECIKLNIPFIAAVPFQGQESIWPKFAQEEYINLIKLAKSIEYVCSPGYAAWKMQRRNEYIVDNCDLLLAYWDKSKFGGTYNCIKYAESVQKDMRFLEINETL